MFTLCYSAESARLYNNANKANSIEHGEIEYTFMIDEDEHGKWWRHYDWPDAREVGHIASYNDITEVRGIRQ